MFNTLPKERLSVMARRFLEHRRASVTVMFAAASIPILGLIGLAVDYGIWNQTNATLSVAANVAAMTAVKVAANAQLAGDPNAQTEGITSGQEWFVSEAGTAQYGGARSLTLTGGPVVTMTMGATVIAKVQYTGTVKSVFGVFYGKASYGISGQATAQVTSAPYLNVELLLDNSSSMDIGATVTDMQRLQQISACDQSNAVYSTGQDSLDPYNSYKYSDSTNTYLNYVDQYGSFPGPLTPPVVITPPAPAAKITLTQSSGVGPKCTGYTSIYGDGKGHGTLGEIPTAGPPCEFACHWDSSSNSGLAKDLYGAARRTINTSAPIQLRFDIVKIATNDIIAQMQADDLAIHNLRVGIFTFNNHTAQVYPTGSEAGDDWATAIADVGLPPTGPTALETGIQPTVGLRQNSPNDDTDIITSLAELQSSYLTTPSGDGTTASTPRKVLFLITDGFMDSTTFGRSAFPTALCNDFKAQGYTIYVVFTPYYPIMHEAYIDSAYGTIINGTTSDPGTLAYGLQQCASSPSDYLSAESLSDLNTALSFFLKAALNTPARFTG